ncbi:TPA: hypothetical protein TUL06_001310 [Streptococcus equi subsp. zooepidemicus]|uniref:hypothetical protein n=1 Tax=Streptococcus equi TaxID=1336 RepID=UPI000DA2A08E|nr:Uncharacterised protein [Streptococcus equi subsp. zooepidemicus]HEL0010041.1 hypothetical protein [Streptococcus equi subsp. zooepidemicus]HEL0012115.1 hypothetical protein [Streptococcus equi subsp. zooepidemicus]HEL0014168.1 hypothetical protein [Streptococcus equi subsp. zooepidemicus]HEL0018202.1 hypothetical protein [Streptococcus equi subsp. zooepidemicus]
MKRLKTLCFLATAITLTLAPISTSQTQSQTVYASAVVIKDYNNGYRYFDENNGQTMRATSFEGRRRSWRDSILDLLERVWNTVVKWLF